MTVSDILVIITRFLNKCANAVTAFLKRIYRSICWRLDIRSKTNGVCITKEQKAEVRSFFRPYFPVSTVFHNFYTEKNGTYSLYYIPDDLYYCYIDPYFNDWDATKVMDNKCLYSLLFAGVKQPQTIACRTNGIWTDSANEFITEAKLSEMLSADNRIFAKIAVESDGGSGVFYLADDKQREKFMKILRDTEIDIILQYPIVQHRTLSALNSSSVNTIRVMSLLTENEVKIYSIILRMGRNGASVDNACSGGISCGISLDGKLKKYAFSNLGVERFSCHPDSGIVFENYCIPGLEEIKEKVYELHRRIPHFRLVSWDFTVNEDGEPVFIEANLRYGMLDFHQINNGPVFGEDTKRILDEVFGKNPE